MTSEVTCSVLNGTDVITAGRDLDVYTAPLMRQATQAATRLAPSRLVIDLTPTTFLDATGLAALVGALRRVRATDGTMVLACDYEPILKAFRITGMDRVFTIRATVEDAVRAVGEDTADG
jgi:anti-sigma B factor antagonist